MSSPYADFPEVDVTDPTDSLGYGSDTLSELFKILNGKILDNRRPNILSPWLWKGPLTIEAIATAPPDIGIYPLAAGQVNLYVDPTSGRLVVRKFSGTVVELENIISLLQDLTNVQITSVANGDGIRYDSTLGKWTNQPFPTGTGEANTISNVGTAGIGVWKQKVGVNHELKKLFPASTKITITDDTANSRISFEILESAINRNNETGTLTVANGGTGATTLTGMLRGNGTSAMTAIGLGSNGDVLTNVSGTPTFQAPAGGGGGAADVSDFTALKTGVWTGIDPLTGCTGLFQGRLQVGSGTITPSIDTTSGIMYTNFATGATSGNTSCVRSLSARYNINLNTEFGARFRMHAANITSIRLFIGFTSNVAADPSASTYLDSKDGFMLYLPSGSSTWNVLYNDGSGAATATNTAVSAGVADDIFTVVLKLVGATPKVQYSINGAAFSDITTNLPSNGVALGLSAGIETTSAASKELHLMYMYVKSK